MQKTLRSRIAAVAVAALGAGLLQAAPAFAAVQNFGSTPSFASTSATALVGSTNSVVASLASDAILDLDEADTLKGVAALTVPTASSVSLTDRDGAVSGATASIFANTGKSDNFNTSAISSGVVTSTTIATGGTDVAVGTALAAGTFTIIPDVPGTYTLTFTGRNAANDANTTVATYTLTVRSLSYTTGDGAAATPYSTGNGVAGAANTVTVTGYSSGATGVRALVTVSGAGATIYSGTNSPVIASDKASAVIGAASSSALVITTPQAGTVTVSLYNETGNASGLFSTTASNTVTITVNAAALTNVYSAAKSTAYANSGDSAGTSTSDAATTSVRVSATPSTTAEAATVTVTQNDGFGNNLTSGYKTVSATITGGGLLGLASDTPTGASVSSAAGATTSIKVFPNGTVGKATLTVAIDGVTVRTLPVVFYGVIKSLTVTLKKNQIKPSSTVADVLFVEAKDSAGQLVADTPTISSATTGVIASGTCAASDPTTDPTTPAKCQLVSGATLGTSVLTVKSSGDTTITATVTVKVTDSTIRTLTASFDAASYAPGAQATLKLVAKDKNGDFVGDGAYTNVFTAAFTTSATVTSTVQFTNATDVTFVDGAATVKFFMPLATGDFKVTATTGTGVYTDLQATSISASAKVAADTTAVDAVKADVVKAQAAITALSTTIAGIQTAITALVASTTATLTLLQSQILKIMKKLGIK